MREFISNQWYKIDWNTRQWLIDLGNVAFQLLVYLFIFCIFIAVGAFTAAIVYNLTTQWFFGGA